MRAALLFALVVCFVPVAIFRPKWGVCAYVFFAICRPDILAYAPSGRMSFVLAAATVFGSCASLDRWFHQLRNPWVLLLLILLAMSLVSAGLALIPDYAWPRYWQFFRASLLAIAIPVLAKTVDDLRHIMLAIVAGVGVVAVKFGIYGLLHGGVRYANGYGGMMADNNTLALALVMGMPLAFYSLNAVQPRWRTPLIGILFFLLTTTILTFSRGAALSFSVGTLMIVRHSKHKIIGLSLLAILGIPVLLLVGPAYFNRIETISSYDSDNSIRARLNNAQAALVLWHDYPLHGVGFGMLNQQAIWPQYVPGSEAGANQVIHNTYAQFLTDTGIIGFLPYVTLLFGSIWWLGHSAKRTRRLFPGLEIYPLALQISLISCSVGTFFLSRDDFDITYMILMCGAAWWALSRTHAKEAAMSQSQLIAIPAQPRFVPQTWAPGSPVPMPR